MKTINVKHSGNSGDIIYSLPSLLGLKQQGKFDKINFYVHLNVPMGYSAPHPLGNVLMNEDFYLKMKPLLESQSYINKVAIYNNEKIDIDLDIFRSIPINLTSFSIPRWYMLFIIGTTYDLSIPWINVEIDETFKDKIMISRNKRVYSQHINYNVLNQYSDKIVFIGVEKEFVDFRIQCPNAKHFYCAIDFLDLAKKIKGCKGFIGCQGFPFTLAEAIKVNRLLETNNFAPNNIPEGGKHYEALFQQEFDYWARVIING